ncbi:hypothetical protein [Plesiomonas shigelloides]|uniref:hypothetical protein n=1 Tax=Plesiomonas shigelloides TaxID=703 RepID=UPI00267492CC|nr:hypothetical protein [Plesiomonas shigelloides]
MSDSLYSLALQNYKHLAIFFTADLALLRHCFIIGTTNFAGYPPVCNREVGGVSAESLVFFPSHTLPVLHAIAAMPSYFAAFWELEPKGGSFHVVIEGGAIISIVKYI